MEVEAAAAIISITTTTTSALATATVEQVSKSSSDQLLSKFADGDDSGSAAKKKLRPRLVVMVKDHRRRSNKYNVTYTDAGDDQSTTPFDSPSSGNWSSSSLVERKTLLTCANNRRSSSTLLRRLGGIGNNGKSSRRHQHLRAGIISFSNESLFGSIHKTWRRTVQGASKVLLMPPHQPLHSITIPTGGTNDSSVIDAACTTPPHPSTTVRDDLFLYFGLLFLLLIKFQLLNSFTFITSHLIISMQSFFFAYTSTSTSSKTDQYVCMYSFVLIVCLHSFLEFRVPPVHTRRKQTTKQTIQDDVLPGRFTTIMTMDDKRVSLTPQTK